MNAQSVARRSSPPPAMPTRIGRYDLLAELGRGGMASVFLARSFGSAGFERLAAVKVLHRELCADPDFVEMFLDEARVAARLHHPNATAIIDLGAEGTRLYMVMDYVEGDTLHAVQTAASALRRAVPLGIALRVVLDALEGLHAAHELKDPDGSTLGLIHRDVTPHNVLVGVDGAARLVDFGIARAACRTGITTVGVVKGKVPFMAPEQIRGKAVDRRADVFAMGVTLWETMALRRCFPMREGAPLSRLAQESYRPLRDFAPQLPDALDDLCRRALAFDPNDRFPSAAAFAEALEEEFRGHVATQRELGQFMSVVAADKVRREREAVRTSAYPMPNRSVPPSALRASSRVVPTQERRPSVAPPRRSLHAPMGDGLFEGEELTAVAPSKQPPSMAPKANRPVTLPPLPELKPPSSVFPPPAAADPSSVYEVATQAFTLQRSRPPPAMAPAERAGAFWPAAPVRPANDVARPAVPAPPVPAAREPAVEAPPPPPPVVVAEAPAPAVVEEPAAVEVEVEPAAAEAPAPVAVAAEATEPAAEAPAMAAVVASEPAPAMVAVVAVEPAPEPAVAAVAVVVPARESDSIEVAADITAISLAPPALPEPVAEPEAPAPLTWRARLKRWWSALTG